MVKVKPPFTSTTGILKYQQQYGLSNHEAASYVIARQALGLGCEIQDVIKHVKEEVPTSAAQV